jgi:diguanylate cyclase (GGDEF)-like protein
MEVAELRNTVPPERASAFYSFVAGVVVAAAACLIASADQLGTALRTAPMTLWLIVGLAVLVDLRPFTTPGNRSPSTIYPSICLSFALLLGWGLAVAIIGQTAAVIGTSIRLRHAPWRAAFNAGQYALSLAAAEAVLYLADLRGPVEPGVRLDFGDMAAIILAAVTWFVVNDLLVTTALWLRFGGGWWDALTRALAQEALASLALLLLGPVVMAAANVSIAMVPLMLVPLYGVGQLARASREAQRRAQHDTLTGLPNRKALFIQMTSASIQLQRAARSRRIRFSAAFETSSPVGETEGEMAEAAVPQAMRYAQTKPLPRMALILLDIDSFKQVNDTLGHAVGDRLLAEVAARLESVASEDGYVARLGGDEFAILAPRLLDAAAARQLAERIAAALEAPVTLDGLPLDVTAAIGIALYPEHGPDNVTLLRHAEVAMYDAKSRGATYAVYSPASDHNSLESLELLADLRKALESRRDDEIALFYQPQVEVTSGEVIGVEALLRWNHPKRGMVDPEEVIRVAEHTAVMRLLTRRVIDDVVVQLAKWRAQGLTVRASINVSARDLHRGELSDQITDLIAAHGVPAEQVQLEITEGAILADPRRVLVTLHKLARMGIALSLDDFGTGYSSLQHLRRLPLAEVKIDRSFVLRMAEDSDDAAIVRSIIELGRALGLRVVAEGVEEHRTWRLLIDAGCDVAQGWFFARPMPADELAAWLARYRPPTRSG